MKGKLIGTALGAGVGLAGGHLFDKISKERFKYDRYPKNWWDKNQGKVYGTVLGGVGGYLMGDTYDHTIKLNQKFLDKKSSEGLDEYMSGKSPSLYEGMLFKSPSQESIDKFTKLRDQELSKLYDKYPHGFGPSEAKPVIDKFYKNVYGPGIEKDAWKRVANTAGLASPLFLTGVSSLAGNKLALEMRKKVRKDMSKSKTKKQSNTGLILGSALGALSGGLGGHILDKKIQAQGNFFNRNKAAIGGTVLGAFGGGIVGNRIDRSFNNSVNESKSTFSDGIKSTQDGLNKDILNKSITEDSINSSFDKLNGGLRKDLVDSLKKSRKDYRLNLQNLALGTVATGVGAGITASAVKDSLNKRNKMQSYINENGDLVQYGTIMFADGSACKGWAVTKMHGMMDSVAKGLGQAANKWSKLPKSAKGAIIGAGTGAVIGGAKKGVKGALVGAAGGAAVGGGLGYAAGTKAGKEFMKKVSDHKFNAFVADKMKATK